MNTVRWILAVIATVVLVISVALGLSGQTASWWTAAAMTALLLSLALAARQTRAEQKRTSGSGEHSEPI